MSITVGPNQVVKPRGKYILHAEAGIGEHCLVRVERLALRVQDDNGVGYSIGNPAKLNPNRGTRVNRAILGISVGPLFPTPSGHVFSQG